MKYYLYTKILDFTLKDDILKVIVIEIEIENRKKEENRNKS